MGKAKDILGKALVFEAGTSVWAVELSRIKEVVKAENIEPLPNSSPRVAGIISVRGEIIPIISSQWCAGKERGPQANISGNILLLQANNEVLGISIDHVKGIEEIHAYDLRHLSSAPELLGKLISCNALVSSGDSVPLLDARLMMEYLKAGQIDKESETGQRNIIAKA